MILHHEQAQQIATVALGQGASEEVKTFAREVLLFQSYEIGLMEQQLEEWGYSRQRRPEKAMAWMGMPVDPDGMPGLASDAEMRKLIGSSGAETDALFLSLMTRHHQGGVHMASGGAQNIDDDDVKALAARMSRNQQLEISELQQARARLGLPEIAYDPG
jgi:uncharacterized protein (DUF305 family)